MYDTVLIISYSDTVCDSWFITIIAIVYDTVLISTLVGGFNHLEKY